MTAITFPTGTLRLPGSLVIAQDKDGALTVTLPVGTTELPGPIVLRGDVRIVGTSRPDHD